MHGHHLQPSPRLLRDACFVQSRLKESVHEASAISALSAELLAILPDDARREYLKAYKRARRLALIGALQETREREEGKGIS